MSESKAYTAVTETKFCGYCGRKLIRQKHGTAIFRQCPKWNSLWAWITGDSDNHDVFWAGLYKPAAKYDSITGEKLNVEK